MYMLYYWTPGSHLQNAFSRTGQDHLEDDSLQVSLCRNFLKGDFFLQVCFVCRRGKSGVVLSYFSSSISNTRIVNLFPLVTLFHNTCYNTCRPISYSRGDHSVAHEPHAARARHWCG
jgi:hypothetical protein